MNLATFFEGFLLQASLILALGAQNLFVLESGLKRRRHFLVAAVCSACDFLLIFIGVLGVSTLLLRMPSVKIAFGVLGVGFLFYYGVVKVRESGKATVFKPSDAPKSPSWRKAAALALGFSLLNPHVYLDTVILIGGYAAKFPDFERRFIFGLGAGTFSVLWFFGLAGASAALSRFLKDPKTMRLISFASGLLLIVLSLKLGLDVWAWTQAYSRF